MQFNIKLNIQTIIRFEQFTGKPFAELDYTNSEDIENLLYVSVLSNNDVFFNKMEFKHIIESPKLLSRMITELQKGMKVMEQFVTTSTKKKDNPEESVTYIKDVAGMLIMDGMNPDYVLYKMDLCDVPIYIEAYERKIKQHMESQRLWAFINILPHVDGKKLKSAQDLYPFPWELEEKKKETETIFEADKEILNEFLRKGTEFFNKK